MPEFPKRIPAELREEILAEFYEECAAKHAENPDSLNVKLPRDAVRQQLDEIMRLVEKQAADLAAGGQLSDFLDENPVPGRFAEFLSREYRAYCLLLNAIKQEIAKTMAATDRALFGKNSRAFFREAAETCIVTGDPLERSDIELHHAVRDGRPPVPLGKRGHAAIEKQSGPRGKGKAATALRELKERRGYSWAKMKKGLEAARDGLTDAKSGGARSVGNACMKETGLAAEELLTLFG